ncbi:MAG: hypothetical protein H8D46_01010 [FCB group bacterium]|nr:hypothetical protein [FCB group bacterium]
MKLRRITILLAISLLVLIIPEQLRAYANGPPNGRTGAPGEGNCTGCHGSFGLDSGPGNVQILSAPEEYIPGDVYTLLVSVSQNGPTRWGFELAAKTASNDQGGVITVTESQFTQTGSSGGITYLKQRSAGTFQGQTGSATWEFDWTAPAEGAGPITFYAAGNAANSNFGTSGDYIYTTSASSQEASFCEATGDVNGDMNLDVLDIVTLVNFILGGTEPTDDQFCASDTNSDGSLDVLDVVSIVNMILN